MIILYKVNNAASYFHLGLGSNFEAYFSAMNGTKTKH